MDKTKADKIITDFLKKIYGFSLSKTMNIDKAEELASRITFEVYKSLLKVDSIHNIDRYVYRIANNTYSQFVLEERNNRELLSKEIEINTEYDEAKEHSYEQIRKEISYLSNLQREIVYKYYFQKLKTKQIAECLNISQARVKWHLIDARNQIKEGFLEKNDEDTTITDNTFSEMRNLGKLGYIQNFIDMSFYFESIISQKIAYSAYYTPKTTIEIAKEIAVPVAFVEDEINHLVENGFINRTKANKFQTNIYIIDKNKDFENKIENIVTKYAKLVGDIYVPLIKNCNLMLNQEQYQVYTPENDTNFLLWSLISFACVTKLTSSDNSVDMSKFMINRKDGGFNIAHAIIPLQQKPVHHKGFSKNLVDVFVNSNSPKNYPINFWMFFSPFDDRDGNFTNWVQKLFFLLYDYMKKNITKDAAHIDGLINLYSKGFIASDPVDHVNIVVTTITKEELITLLPDMPDELINIGKQFNEEMYKIHMEHMPLHMKDLCYVMNQNSLRKGLLRICLINYLLEKGILKPLKPHQKKTVNMILFSDVLPENL